MSSCEGCIAHQPVASRDPPDEGEHKVDGLNFKEVLSDRVEPMVDAPDGMNINAQLYVRVLLIVDDPDQFNPQSPLLGSHVLCTVCCH